MKKKKISIPLLLLVAVAFSAPRPTFAERDDGTKADSTRMNKEPSNREMTADQQSQSDADKKITQKIRQAVVKNKSLSTYAHNVKIITRNGMVTVKGPVSSAKEKQAVENAAARVVGKEKVTSELEVAPK